MKKFLKCLRNKLKRMKIVNTEPKTKLESV